MIFQSVTQAAQKEKNPLLLGLECQYTRVHETTTKGIVGGFEFTVLQRNLKELHERLWTYVCEC